MHAQLKILTWQNEEIASDALSIHGYEHYEATDYALAAWYPRQPKALAAPGDETGTGKRSSDFTKWWADGDEPLYYIVSSKVNGRSSFRCSILRSYGTGDALWSYMSLSFPTMCMRQPAGPTSFAFLVGWCTPTNLRLDWSAELVSRHPAN